MIFSFRCKDYSLLNTEAANDYTLFYGQVGFFVYKGVILAATRLVFVSDCYMMHEDNFCEEPECVFHRFSEYLTSMLADFGSKVREELLKMINGTESSRKISHDSMIRVANFATYKIHLSRQHFTL